AYWSVGDPNRMYVEFRGSLRSKLMAVVSRGAFDGRGGGPMAADPDGVLGGARARVTGRLTAQGGALLLSVARAADVEVVTAAPPARVAADGPPVAVDLNDVEAVERALYRTVVVEGTAGAVGQAAGPVVGWPMREYGSGFQVVVRSAARPAIEARHGPLAELEGRRIRVTGRLRTYWGRPEVVVTGAGQVEVVGGR
ncbi:MAG TPA: hypothetical protein VEA69_22805, partial [Tepidisphaeraceae bacterium]|nr:hypothetical protein [Tepidisphaeraceae bacterium]